MASMDYEYSAGNRSILSRILDCSNSSGQEVAIPQQIIESSNNDTTNARLELKETEDLLASELNKLSVKERSSALDDVHCVGEDLKETPEMIEQSLIEFEQTVQHEKTAIYDTACEQNRSYVEDRSFRLMFLRASFFDVVTSVRKMMKLLECKAKYFGNDKVARDITLDDLNEEDIGLMLSGLYHIQGGRDRSGRVVVYIFNHMLGRCRIETLTRVAYYIWMHIIVPIPEVQMKGTNAIYYDMTRPGEQIPTPSWGVVMDSMQLAACLPVRNSAIHLCLKSGSRSLAGSNAILGFALQQFSRHERVRASLQVGSDMELQYHLRGRGIPMHSFPVHSDGTLREDVLNAWFYKHRDGIDDTQLSGDEIDRFFLAEDEDDLATSNQSSEVEEMSSQRQNNNQDQSEDGNETMGEAARNPIVEQQPARNVVQQSDRDVLLGKGKSYQNHPGNIYFRSFLEKYADHYDRAPRNARRQICTQLNHILRAKGVRFIQQEGADVWVECDAKAAEKKIGQLFRSLRKRK